MYPRKPRPSQLPISILLFRVAIFPEQIHVHGFQKRQKKTNKNNKQANCYEN
jgi:hypothetical protein